MFSSPNGNSNVPAFIAKLWHMVSNPKFDHLIFWSDDGYRFIIKNHARFSSEVLPMYYKHNNMASFIRQLNKYGFHKVMAVGSSIGDKGDFEFAHPNFVKECPELLSQIKRKLTSNAKETDCNRSDSSLVTKLLQDVQQLQAKQNVFESKLSMMKNENDALWREHAILRQRHQKQQKIVNKLIQFLVTLVQQTRGLNINRRIPLMLKNGARPGENLNLMAIKDSGRSTTPLICEVDPYNMNIGEKSQKIATSPNPTIRNGDVTIQITPLGDTYLGDAIVTPCREDELIVLSTASCDDPLGLSTNTDFAVPLQEISPAIVQTNHPIVAYVPPAIIPSETPENSQVQPNKKDKTTNQKHQKLTQPARKAVKRKKSSISNIDWDCSNTDSITVSAPSNICAAVLDSSPPHLTTTTSPSVINEQQPSTTQESSSNKDTALVLSDLFPVMKKSMNMIVPSVKTLPDEKSIGYYNSECPQPKLKEEMDNHIDMVQTDLDLLRDILHSEGLSLDASTLMGLFNADDPLSLNLPEASRDANEDELASGNEIVAYSPSLIDMNDILADQNEDYTNVTRVPSPNDFNTPLVEFDEPSYTTSPSPSRRVKN